MLRRFAPLLCLCVLGPVARAQDVKLSAEQLTPGLKIDLSGTWQYKPGYDKSEGDGGFVSVPVPQVLSRINWWLDDSEDFKKDEDARLKKLGFDTERAEDGWYRKAIELPESGLPKNTRVFIEFDGVAMRSDVFINGTKLGHHDGMFGRFEYDLTPHLKPGKNELKAFVSMEKMPPAKLSMGTAVTVNLTASKVISMSKGMFGPFGSDFPNRVYDLHGIWQPVRLVVTGSNRITDVWFRPALDGGNIDVEVAGEVGDVPFVAFKLTDAKTGEVLAEDDDPAPEAIAGGHRGSFRLSKLKPKLWTPAEPNLYALEVRLIGRGGRAPLLDRSVEKVGFRTFEARDGKFFLNGKPYWMRGANQSPYGKNPTDPALARKLIQQLHDNNVRVTRTHATPWNTAWLDAADEIGLGVSVEGIRPWGLAGKIGATPPDMFKHWMMEQADVIKHLRNHPSVLIWTVGNEMMLRDGDNPEKWKQLSEAVMQTRAADPTRPVVCSSTYVRETKQYDKVIAPNKFDDGDIDDPHSYKAWYGNTPFVSDSKFEADFKKRQDVKRPYFGQEFSTGYPDLDTGLPVLRYTRDLMTPQAFVGVRAYPGNDTKWFLEYNRAVTKRWAEQLRFQSHDKTAGFQMFSAECWFSHSYDAKRAKAYPVVEAIKQAFSPVGLAIETNRRRFYAGERVATNVFVVNDDEQSRDLKSVKVSVGVVDANNGKLIGQHFLAPANVEYYATAKLPVELVIPAVSGRKKFNLVIRAVSDAGEISRTVDPIEVFEQRAKSPIDLHESGDPHVTFVGPKADAHAIDLALSRVENGGTAILFSPSMKEMLKRFPNDIFDDEKVVEEDYQRRVKEAKAKGQEVPRKPEAAKEPKKEVCEFVDWSPARGTMLANALEPMDLRWWGRMKDERVFVGSGSFRLKPGGRARELFRYIPPHGYIPEEQLPWQVRSALFEIPHGKGRVWVCTLDLETCVGADPVADIVAANILRAAADPDSTKHLKPMPSHEQMLKGKLPN
jgi:hypothetical protein